VAAQEQQDERVVGFRDARLAGDRRRPDRRRELAVGACRVAPVLVDEPTLGGPDEPRGGPFRDAVPWPMIGRGDERLLDRVLGRVEVACPSGDDAKDLRRKVAQQVLDRRFGAQIG
jgi:hypothetical protein